jgi:hypothetical protein
VDCPRCGAHARADAQWCTLCYAELRPAATSVAPAELVSQLAGSVEPGAAAEQPVGLQGPAPRGKHARRASSYEVLIPELAASEEPALGVDAMLAQLAADSGKPFPGLAGRFDSKAARVGIIAGGIVGVSVVMILLMVLVGSLL